MTDELVKRLRGDWFGYEVSLKAIDAMEEAADRIEALTAQLESTLKDRAKIIADLNMVRWARDVAVDAANATVRKLATAEAERDRLREAGNDAAKALRVIAGMDLMGASAVAFNAARELEAALKGEGHE